MFKDYIEKFNANDNELIKTSISNQDCYNFLLQNAPYLECPDPVIEETFAFRAWTIRKHLKQTEIGTLMSEFLPSVSWAGKYNTINAPLFHHLNEYRYFKNAEDLLAYVWFFIDNVGGNGYVYSTPALTAVCEFLTYIGQEELLLVNANKLENYFKNWEEKHLTASGLYFSYDNYDAMEISISGTIFDKNAESGYETWLKTGDDSYASAKAVKGFRPTLNAYMYGDAISLSKIFEKKGDKEKAEFYRSKAMKIKTLVDQKLWDGDFYKAVYFKDADEDVSYKDIPKERDVKELIAYNLWANCLPGVEKATMFKYLKDEKVFSSPAGFTTADQSHPLFLYTYPHECLWNGYVWPFATSQALNGVIALLNNYEQDIIDNQDLYNFIKTYAQMHYLEENGKRVNWIDEVMHPYTREWTSRTIWNNFYRLGCRGIFERGKDYNHSTFIDLVLRGLIGVDVNAETFTVKPRVVGIWKWFKVENVSFKKNVYNVYYDEDGSKYNKGVGLIIEKC